MFINCLEWEVRLQKACLIMKLNYSTRNESFVTIGTLIFCVRYENLGP